jgi:hypothetical protein
MHKKYHILNGDSLRKHFPQQIDGEVLVMRECLVEGDVQGEDLEDLFRTRSEFINSHYEGCNEDVYRKEVISEFEKMQSIPEGSEINLWFEDDLFCQVNLWFVISLLSNSDTDYSINLVRPLSGHEYCLVSMTEAELLEAYTNKTEISSADIKRFCKLWEFYQRGDCQEMARVAKELDPTFPFVMPACEAHTDRFPLDGSSGRPVQSIMSIMEELDTTDFKPVFLEFCKRESIYGFGDVQVKRLYDHILKNT